MDGGVDLEERMQPLEIEGGCYRVVAVEAFEGYDLPAELLNDLPKDCKLVLSDRRSDDRFRRG